MTKFNTPENTKQKSLEYESRCIDCKACMKNCPMLDEFCESPKELLGRIGRDDSQALELPFSCSLCQYCARVCPKDIDFSALFHPMRAHIVNSGSITSKPLAKGLSVVGNHQRLSFSKAFASSFPKPGKKATTAFIPGCSLASYSPELVMSAHAYLQDKIGDVGLILQCCGKPTNSIGDTDKFIEYYSRLEKMVEEMSCDTIVTACQNCYKTIGKFSPHIKVTSLWEVMADLGLPERAVGIGSGIDSVFALHDPCPTRNVASIHDGAREIIRQLGLNMVEFKSNRSFTACCGQGGMIGLTNPKLGIRQMKKRASEGKDADYIITYCESCVEAMHSADAKSLHILDIIFGDKLEDRDLNQIRPGFAGKWLNRYRIKRLVDKLD
ncbi:MAG: (Fe-S)-binding protein [Peptoclostridium sp.]|uniref:(Fe-S)-binding protein n=1 Tax=Peptoclostridium sp. TaxID=1904860 RepID=UPI00139D1141|nr:(Fe-S)-binding protein [Peptoclostridium sp.]MZQ75956.1 (Fe-S)-binding protein [Peptoclostridium sp.]